MNIQLVSAYSYPQETGDLFSEYTKMLTEGDGAFQKYLDIQHYEDEVAHLEMKYGLPGGRLYLACWDGKAAGCIGLRKLDSENCEMKRLYVRPAYQGKGIGGRLIRQVIADAKEIGYSYMLLDTLPFLEKAVRIYEKFGFYRIPAYNDSPLDTSIYMKLDLAGV